MKIIAAKKSHRAVVCPEKRKLPALRKLGFVAVFVAIGLTAGAQYSINWFKVSGGGGTSTNGQLSVSGTVGQHDAGGSMSGNGFKVTGGFWVLPVAVPVVGAPTLAVVPGNPGQATVFWTPATPGWVLQEGPEITGAWTNSPSGATNPVSVPAALPRKFFRLFKP